MATLSQTTGTGHNPRKESKVAYILYIAIAAAVIIAFLYFALASKMNEGGTPNVGAPDQDRPADSTNPPPAPPTQE